MPSFLVFQPFLCEFGCEFQRLCSCSAGHDSASSRYSCICLHLGSSYSVEEEAEKAEAVNVYGTIESVALEGLQVRSAAEADNTTAFGFKVLHP
jgi:hypothetical protein